MKSMMIAAFLGTLALGATAQSQSDDTSVRIPGYPFQLPAQPHRLMPGDFDAFKGAYDMSNGDSMVLRQIGRKVYADVGDRPRTELIAAARNEFVSVDRQLKMTLNTHEDGPVTGELLIASPVQEMGQARGAGVTVALLSSR
jgi:hypothetical protein